MLRVHHLSWVLAAALAPALLSSGCDDKGDAGDNAPARADKSGDKTETKTEDAKADAGETKPDETKADTGAAEADPAAAAGSDGGETGGADSGETDGAEAIEPGEKGPTYFAVRDRGVVKLDEGGFAMVEGAPDILLRDMHVAADGKLYLLTSKGIMHIDDTKAKMVAETSFKTTGTVDAFAVDKDGTVWAVGYKGISHHDGKAWTTEDKKVLGGDVTLIKGVAIDGTGRVWVASSNQLHVREGDAWVEVDVSSAFSRKPFFESVRVAPDGTVYAIASAALVQAKDKDAVSAVDLKLSGFASLGMLSFSANGIMALRSRVDGVVVRQPDGTTTEYRAGKAFEAESIRSVGVDTTGRAWVGTDLGVAILVPGTDEAVQWRSGSVLELAGHVEHIVPIGAGPDLPEVGEVKTGGIKGKVLTDGKALADTEVEMCPSPDTLFKTSPCGDSPVKFSGKTSAEGEFSFDAVPIGAYGVAVKVGGKWQLTMSSNFGTKMKEGDTYDIGSINVKAK